MYTLNKKETFYREEKEQITFDWLNGEEGGRALMIDSDGLIYIDGDAPFTIKDLRLLARDAKEIMRRFVEW